MTRRLLVILGVFSAMALLAPIAAAAAPTARAEPEDFTVDAGIRATVNFVDNGANQGLEVTGSGSGFDTNGTYVSLIYDAGSVAENVTAAGVGPCEPTTRPGQPGFLNGPKMFVGFWLSGGKSQGSVRTLKAVKTRTRNTTALPPPLTPETFIDPFDPAMPSFVLGNTFTPLGTFATISVRRVDAGFSLNECGTVMSTGAKTAKANIAGFGVDTGIEAKITFEDNGPTKGLVVTGKGSGFQPNGLYISLIYDRDSVQSGVTRAGSGPCEPAIFDPNQPGFISFPQMVVGFWLTAEGRGTGSTKRTLKAVKTNKGNTTIVPPEFLPFINPNDPNPLLAPSYTPIGTFATVSVRRVDAGFGLHACGDVESNGRG